MGVATFPRRGVAERQCSSCGGHRSLMHQDSHDPCHHVALPESSGRVQQGQGSISH